ncbi:MAG: hypothetical protein D6730_14675 [Bacteroidetes bacterium]|nr:MAG: hypothetical protein D6730_14675 [Bacteroidota bacterium]
MSEYNENSVVTVIVRVLPKGDEYDLELPLYTTGGEIVEAMLSQNVVPRSQGGEEYEYQLVSKEYQREVLPSQTLWDLQIQSGNTLLLTPKLVAGA